MTLDVDAAARRLLDQRAAAVPVPNPPPAARLPDLAAGYAAQHAMDRILVAERGHRRLGWKIGATGAGARAQLGIAEPFFGRLYDHLALPSGASLPWNPLWRAHEPEIALRLGRDLDPRDAPFDAAAIAAATEAVLPAIEIIGTVFDPWREAGAPMLIADNAVFGFWVMGTPVTDWRGLDLLDAPVRLLIDGAEVATGRGGSIEGGALGATAWLANAMARQGLGLRAGDHITTGSVTTPVPAAAGQRVRAVFDGLGEVALDIAAA